MTYENGTLLLQVVSELYEAECDKCDPHMPGAHVTLDQIGNNKPWKDCPVCHGTGTRTVRLEGLVAPLTMMVRDGKSIVFHTGYSYIGRKDDVIDWYIQHHKADTLPSELYQSADNPDGLREVPE